MTIKFKTGLLISVIMPGYEQPPNWKKTGEIVSVKFPDNFENIKNRPCDYAWILKLKKPFK